MINIHYGIIFLTKPGYWWFVSPQKSLVSDILCGSAVVFIQTCCKPCQVCLEAWVLVWLFGLHHDSFVCIHTCIQGPDKREKLTELRWKQTKQCRYTLSPAHLCLFCLWPHFSMQLLVLACLIWFHTALWSLMWVLSYVEVILLSHPSMKTNLPVQITFIRYVLAWNNVKKPVPASAPEACIQTKKQTDGRVKVIRTHQSNNFFTR